MRPQKGSTAFHRQRPFRKYCAGPVCKPSQNTLLVGHGHIPATVWNDRDVSRIECHYNSPLKARRSKAAGRVLMVCNCSCAACITFSTAAICSFRIAAMRFCSARGGRGTLSYMSCRRPARGIRDPVTPIIAWATVSSRRRTHARNSLSTPSRGNNGISSVVHLPGDDGMQTLFKYGRSLP